MIICFLLEGRRRKGCSGKLEEKSAFVILDWSEGRVAAYNGVLSPFIPRPIGTIDTLHWEGDCRCHLIAHLLTPNACDPAGCSFTAHRLRALSSHPEC